MFRSLPALLLTSVAFAQNGPPEPPRGRYNGEIREGPKNEFLMRVAMSVPAKLPERRTLGLLFLCHGFNGNENNYIGGTVDCLKRLGLLEHYVVIAGKSRDAGWTPQDDQWVLRIIAWAKASYPVDSRRVFLFGSSNGAAYVGRFGWEHQDLVAAVTAYCGSFGCFQNPPPGPNGQKPQWPPNAAETRTEWYFVHGGADNPENSRRACKELKARGYRTIFRQLDGYGHTDIWDGNGHPDKTVVDAVRDDWVTWVHSLRHKEMPPSADERKALSGFLSRVKTEKLDALGNAIAEAARVGGAPGGRVIGNAVDSLEPDVRLAATTTAESNVYGKEVLAELHRLLRDKSDAVRLSAIRGIAFHANLRFEDAQATLCRLARTKSLPAAERMAAVGGLSRTVKLALLGNTEDRLPFWTLAALLDEEEATVREAALAAFEQLGKDTFNSKPDVAAMERRAAATKWKTYVSQKVGPLEGPGAK